MAAILAQYLYFAVGFVLGMGVATLIHAVGCDHWR
jgi:hypothetical protein